ncbi:MAG: IS66 family transposase [Dermatophilaceae bacterium]
MPDAAPAVEQLLAMLVQRDEVIASLQARIVELERRLGQNSKNSSRPPSGDRMERSPSRAAQRKAGRKPGKQPGGPGSTLRRTDAPDAVVEHVPTQCLGCGAGLDQAPVVKTRARQVVDIPEVSASVTEHQIVSCRCACGHVTDGQAPAGVSAPVQYGPNLRALAAYLVVYQHVPVERAAELIGDVTGACPSTGWISSVIAAAAEQLVETDALIRTLLILALVLHVDETSINVNGHKQWLHVASTGTLTSYFLHQSRGRTAVDAFGILPAFTGVCVHDGLSVYDGPGYAKASHAFCGAHIARELVAAAQADPDQAWPAAALDALYDLNTAAHHARSEGHAQIASGVLEPLLFRWTHALLCALAVNPHRDGPKQSKTRNLLTRLTSREEQVLRFARDLRVGFTNNQAERDLRPVKTQLKISGCHRSSGGAQAWLRIRGYISTMRKNGAPVLTGLRDAITGNPWTPATT